MSGDDRVVPILGYGIGQSFDPSDTPDGLSKMLQAYKEEITYVIEHEIPASRRIQADWNSLTAGSFAAPATRATVAPLMTTTWDQAPYYNQLCPFDNQYNALTVSGCVATAMCQIMNYWEYPTQGSGFHSYSHTPTARYPPTLGLLPTIGPQCPIASVATMLLSQRADVPCRSECGHELRSFPNRGSGAYVVTAASPSQHCSEYALETYFGYDANSLQGVLRNNYSTANWIQLLKGELDAGRPILYAGFGSGGGHAWHAMGITTTFSHELEGWGGNSDGYFTVDAPTLAPSEQEGAMGASTRDSKLSSASNRPTEVAAEEEEGRKSSPFWYGHCLI